MTKIGSFALSLGLIGAAAISFAYIIEVARFYDKRQSMVNQQAFLADMKARNCQHIRSQQIWGGGYITTTYNCNGVEVQFKYDSNNKD